MGTEALAGASARSAHGEARQLIVAWQHPRSRAVQPIGILGYDGLTYSFHYIRAVNAVDDFRPLLGLADLQRRYESEELFPIFSQRVMEPTRPDFERYVTRLGLDPREVVPWEQIARSGGARHGDTLHLIPIPTVEKGAARVVFLTHGVRHIPTRPVFLDGLEVLVTEQAHSQALEELHDGDSLSLISEPQNTKSPRAVLVANTKRVPLGYVPELLTSEMAGLRKSTTNIQARVLRINGADAPSHMRLIVEVTADIDPNFEFLKDANWLPF